MIESFHFSGVIIACLFLCILVLTEILFITRISNLKMLLHGRMTPKYMRKLKMFEVAVRG